MNSQFYDLEAFLLSFIWSLMVMFGLWIPFIPFIVGIMGWVFWIAKIPLQHKVRVSWLEKQREKGADYSNASLSSY